MVKTEEVTKQISLQRLRNSIMECLETVLTFERDGEYGNAIDEHLLGYITNMWGDYIQPGWQNHVVPPVFSCAERDAIAEFDKDLENCDALIDERWPDLLKDSPPWDELRHAAQRSLAAFAQRGRFPEDEELSFERLGVSSAEEYPCTF